MTIRTRFAPSPTGFLHIGGARTALYAWLLARHSKGKFILRIEDTDRARSTDEAIDAILESMKWLGLDYDEGPFYQTKRFDRYAQVIQEMLEKGLAYRCYCTRERLEQLREEQVANKLPLKYDGKCRGLKESEQDLSKPHVIRFKNPIEGSVVWDDMVRGRVEVSNAQLDDLIIARTDGTPTYNFTVVVDDADMKMTHVLRGDDHISNTPRQINMFYALGIPVPIYAHVPNILGDDGKKLSKRHGAVSVMQYRDDGFLPQAVLNYLVRLGWSHKDQEIFSVKEMIELFDANDINKSAAAFNTDKLIWLNQHYIKTLPIAEVMAHLQWHLDNIGLKINNGPKLEDVVDALRERVKTLDQMANMMACFYEDFNEFDESAAKKHLRVVAKEPLILMKDKLEKLDKAAWQNDELLHDVVKAVAEELSIGMGKVGQPLRVALSGTSVSPPIDVTLRLVGRDRALARIAMALEFIRLREIG